MRVDRAPADQTSTPQNTPLDKAPISSRAQQPGVSSIKEGMRPPLLRFSYSSLTPSNRGCCLNIRRQPRPRLDDAEQAQRPRRQVIRLRRVAARPRP